MRRAPTRTLVCLALLAGSACAEDDESKFENHVEASLQSSEQGAALTVRGKAPGLPDGTTLHVTLQVKGNLPTPVVGAFFKVVVRGGAFSATERRPGKTFAPLEYWIRTDLWVSEQGLAIQQFLADERGWGPRHRALLASTDLILGTAKERAEFRRLTAEALLGFVSRTEPIRDRAAEAAKAAPDPEAPTRETQRALQKELRALAKAQRAYFGRHVVWREEAQVERLQLAQAEISRALRACSKGRHQEARRNLERTKHFLQALRAELEGVLRPRREVEPDRKEE